METSAKEDENVKEAFFKMMEEMHWLTLNSNNYLNKNGNGIYYLSNKNKNYNNSTCCGT